MWCSKPVDSYEASPSAHWPSIPLHSSNETAGVGGGGGGGGDGRQGVVCVGVERHK